MPAPFPEYEPTVRSLRSVAACLLLASAPAAPAALLAQSENAPRVFIVPAKPPKNPDAARWYSNVRDAFAEARKLDRKLLVDLYADWCGWCKVMDAKVFSTPEFAQFAADFVLLRIDVEDGAEGSELAARYPVETLPALLILEPEGALISEIRGYKPTEDIAAEAKASLFVHAKAVETYERIRLSSDPEALRRAASDHYRRRDGARAATLFARLIEVAPSEGDDALWLRFFLADSLRRAARFEEASKAFAPLAGARAQDVELGERIALLPFWIARDAARCADASTQLADFERGHPESLFLPGAKRAMAELRSAKATCS